MFRWLTRRPRYPKTPGGVAVARDGYGPNWHTQRKKALKRDDYKCQNCGKKAKHRKTWWQWLAVHHKRKIRLFYLHAEERIDYDAANRLDNLVVLCHRCHKAADGAPRGFRRFA